MDKLLEIENLSIRFNQYVKGLKKKELKVLYNLSLDIYKNEIVVILGSSGSGKSLIAHALLGILPETSKMKGVIKYKGNTINKENISEFRKSHISLIPQSVNFLNPLMKVKEQVIGFCDDLNEYHQKSIKQEKIFEKYGLSKEVGDLYPFQLSGGMARKVLFATVLIDNPDIIVADEPTTGLDELSIKEMINDLLELKANGTSILLITHDIDIAMKVSDRIAILYAGHLIEITDSKNFSNDGENLYHPYTKSLYQALPSVDFKLTKGHQPLLSDVINCPYIENCMRKTEKCYNGKIPIKNINGSMVMCHHPLNEELL